MSRVRTGEIVFCLFFEDSTFDEHNKSVNKVFGYAEFIGENRSFLFVRFIYLNYRLLRCACEIRNAQITGVLLLLLSLYILSLYVER